jgi:signal transduction histidine kinase
MEVAIGSTQIKRSSREESPSIRALLTLLCASSRSIFDAGDAVAFRWDAAARRFEFACGWEGERQLWEGDFDSWIAEHPQLLPALERGDDVSFAGRVLIPIASPGRLEGTLALAADRPVDSSTRLALRRICEPAAVILAVMRERDQAMETMVTIASELTDPLMAARGFTRMALDEARTTCVGSPEYLSAALRNINRLGEIAVGLQHACIDA